MCFQKKWRINGFVLSVCSLITGCGGMSGKDSSWKEPHPLTTTPPHTACMCVNRAIRTGRRTSFVNRGVHARNPVIMRLINDSICGQWSCMGCPSVYMLCILKPWELDSTSKADSHARCRITCLSQTCAVYLPRLQGNETYSQPAKFNKKKLHTPFI